MKRKALLMSAVVALALAALPAAAGAQLKIIAIQAKAGGTTYGVAPNSESIPVDVGDRVRIDLVGTSIEGGRGVERPVNARFDVISGRGRIDIGQSGPNWVVVNVRSGGDNELAQLGYTVSGGYDMRDNLRSGRISLALGNSRRSAAPQRGDVRDDRMARARELNRMLYRSIVNESPRGNPDRREDVDRIYQDGFQGIRAVALDLAREEQHSRNYARLGQDEAVRIMGDLYRGLLGRDQSDREMWDRDRGFRGNVDALRRYGLERVVDGIVSSAEFRSVNKLAEFENDRNGRYSYDNGRSGRYDGRYDGRYGDGRYGDWRDRDRRPPMF